MKILILQGSLRPGQNTETLTGYFTDELLKRGATVESIALRDKKIAPCSGCGVCQDILDGFGCVHRDDMYEIVDRILACDCFVLATPIYTWYCTPPMKNMLDRHYGMNKYYGEKEGPCMWEGKKCAILATYGYKEEYAVSPFEDGVKRLCKHSRLTYIGKSGWRDINGITDFKTPQAEEAARTFAAKILAQE